MGILSENYAPFNPDGVCVCVRTGLAAKILQSCMCALEPDYTIVPSSPLFSRSAGLTQTNRYSQGSHGSHLAFRPAHHATNGFSRSALDKMSTMSGEDSIHEHPPVENGPHGRMVNGLREQNWCVTEISREFAELGPGTTPDVTNDWDFIPDNVPIARKPITSGFLVSFLVDARGGSMRGSRHPGLRILVPPSAASAPTRITCRMLRPERTTRPPQLNDSEGLACRIIELGPHPCSFNTPVLLEIPHFASLRGRQRELVVLRSDNAETWREHSLEATDQAVQSALGQNFDALETMEELREKRIIRILTNDFPQYLAVVSRLRQETALIGSDGGVLSSTVVPQVQAVFPEGALQKRIRVGLQAHPIPADMVARLLGNRVAVSPIVTLEPRRRKFHKPITLTIPLPKTALRGMINPSGGDPKSQNAPTLRLLCSITGGTLPAQWEDITGSTPLSKVKDCVSFTTTVSARFWLMDCQPVHDSTEMAGHLYREASLVPYMGKFVVFTKRLDSEEALIRCFCVTDDKVDKTLECQEGFEVCAASPEVEVVEGRPAWLEAAGNLHPVAKSGEQLNLHFNAFRENRLAFPVRVRDLQSEPTGKLAFMREPRSSAAGSAASESARSDATPQRPICTLEVNLGSVHASRAANSTMADMGLLSLSDQLNTSAAASMQSIPCVFPQFHPDVAGADEHGGFVGDSRWAAVYSSDIIARSQLDLLHVASEVGADWPKLVGVLLPESRLGPSCTVEQLVDWITQNEARWQEARIAAGGDGTDGFGGVTAAELRTDRDQALAVLLAWKEQRGDLATGNELEKALRAIGRTDVVKSCMRDIQCVMEEDEHREATKRIDEKWPREPVEPSASAEPPSSSVAGTTTLMSGMEDIAVGQYGAAPAVGDKTQRMDQEPSASSEQQEASPSAEESVVQEVTTGVAQELPMSEETSGQDEQEAEDVALEGLESGTPPASSTSQQGGDPLLVHAAHEPLPTDDGPDMVRDSESMTASFDGATGTEDGGRAMGEKDEKPGNSFAPGFFHEDFRDEGLEPAIASVEGEASTSAELEDFPKGQGVMESGDKQKLADAHHAGGEGPSSDQLSAPVKYFSEETTELVEEGVTGKLAEQNAGISETQQSLVFTAHHGVSSEHLDQQ
ncbi:ankyrin [Clonorchis sinensis]|uniref:Ankyrin n=1 Tax=Clonorchis sinensis TaxID=79923 RepID=H2KSW0_CLOSI|nr:ankyrin [Clonorchis sinensis]